MFTHVVPLYLNIFPTTGLVTATSLNPSRFVDPIVLASTQLNPLPVVTNTCPVVPALPPTLNAPVKFISPATSSL